ncbi:hypothetical protein ACTXT7_009642, partial [Hymenolepis weldensis]
ISHDRRDRRSRRARHNRLPNGDVNTCGRGNRGYLNGEVVPRASWRPLMEDYGSNNGVIDREPLASYRNLGNIRFQRDIPQASSSSRRQSSNIYIINNNNNPKQRCLTQTPSPLASESLHELFKVKIIKA